MMLKITSFSGPSFLQKEMDGNVLRVPEELHARRPLKGIFSDENG